jgi:hypothetical protein
LGVWFSVLSLPHPPLPVPCPLVNPLHPSSLWLGTGLGLRLVCVGRREVAALVITPIEYSQDIWPHVTALILGIHSYVVQFTVYFKRHKQLLHHQVSSANQGSTNTEQGPHAGTTEPLAPANNFHTTHLQLSCTGSNSLKFTCLVVQYSFP